MMDPLKQEGPGAATTGAESQRPKHNLLGKPQISSKIVELDQTPNSEESEACALACVLTADAADASGFVDKLTEADFWDIRHQAIIRALKRLRGRREAIGVVGVINDLRSQGALEDAGGMYYVMQLPDRTHSAAHFDVWLQELRNLTVRRAKLQQSAELRKAALDPGFKMEGAGTVRLLDRAKARLFNHDLRPEEPEPRFLVNGISVSTPGNLTAISAPAKSGKSAWLGAMMAAAMTQDPDADCLGLTSTNPSGHAVLHIDTEQSRADHWDLVSRAVRRANLGSPPAWLRSYCLTGFGATELRQLLPQLMADAKEQTGGIHSVLLDGVGDCVNDVNDPEECNGFVAELHALAIEYSCPIVSVIHLNPGSDSKTRGHLGSQLERKAESNLKLERDKEGAIVAWSDKNRRAPILRGDGPRFAWSSAEEMHVSVESQQAVKDAEDREELLSLAEAVFSDRVAMPRADFASTLKTRLSSCLRTAQRNVVDMLRLGVIAEGPDGLVAINRKLRT